MNLLAVLAASGAGAVAGVPVAAVAYAMSAEGPVRLPARWWRGRPARPSIVAGTALITGASAGLAVGSVPMTAAAPAFWLFAVVGIGLSIMDVRRHRLPHALTGGLWAACIVCFTAAATVEGDVDPLRRAIIAGVAASAGLLAIALALPGQLGLGDVVLGGAVTLSLGWLSWRAALLGLVAALLLQAAVGLGVSVRARQAVIPMGPALIAGWLVAICAAP